MGFIAFKKREVMLPLLVLLFILPTRRLIHNKLIIVVRAYYYSIACGKYKLQVLEVCRETVPLHNFEFFLLKFILSFLVLHVSMSCVFAEKKGLCRRLRDSRVRE